MYEFSDLTGKVMEVEVEGKQSSKVMLTLAVLGTLVSI